MENFIILLCQNMMKENVLPTFTDEQIHFFCKRDIFPDNKPKGDKYMNTCGGCRHCKGGYCEIYEKNVKTSSRACPEFEEI